ncbi:hypothetical protein AXG93_3390s1040 [Marchantia polymorpha subsp. ruderalis]|uniref:Uncharacterized protein n=1 Tax=Marchantia polymorpha subsp. ruderalis TaxID=1480154 RepID=A0A176VQZ8_MARPO|nr:hypothetical protein AXG93_3390s1040 [Marchantia polymorpha subsp. ruderalis]
MKARRLIIKDDRSTKGNVAALQGRLTSAKWAELEADVAETEEEDLRRRAFGVKTFSGTGERRVKEDQGEGGRYKGGYPEAKSVTFGQDYCVHSIREEELRRTIILETKDNPLAEETQSSGINAADVVCEQVVSLLRYLNGKLEKLLGHPISDLMWS